MNEYKKSEIDWIGNIPKQWDISRIKYTSEIYTGNSISDSLKSLYEDSENAYPYISTKDIDANDDTIDYNNGLYTKKNDFNFRVAPKNSTLLCIEGGSAGRKISKLNQNVSFVNKLCCFNAKSINPNYLYFYLKSKSFKEEFNQHISGLIGGVSQSILKSFYIIVPPKEEQSKISNYLNDKITKLDCTLKKLYRQIEILEKYKKSIITETIISGLNNNKDYKDSGDSWIKYIPNNYIITKVKYVTQKVTDGSHIAPDTTENIHKFVSVTDMNEFGTIDFLNCLKITDEQYEYLVKTGCKPKKKDVIISKDGTIGKTTIIDNNEDFVIASSLVIMRPNNIIINERYLRYNLMSEYVQAQLETLLVGSALKRVSVYKNANLRIILTKNINEQIEIANYLDKKCNLINTIIKNKKSQIEKIENYKQSIIYEYVTGKKRVKGE